MTAALSRLVCAGCGTVVAAGEPLPFRCPNAGAPDDVDHVLRRELDLGRVAFPSAAGEPNPFLRYRSLLHAFHVATAGGIGDDAFCDLVRDLDARVAAVDGNGFRETPFARAGALSDALGFSLRGGVWIKDETGNVSGSHKGRHLFGVLLHLEVVERLGLVPRGARPELAIASCGNAALAAAVVAAAGGRALRVFVPVDADPVVLARLDELGARVETCPRTPGLSGDPTYARLLDAIDAGAIPFTCQGNLNGLAVEAGETLGWELVSQGPPLDRVVVQVGGGALASAVAHALREAEALAAGGPSPRLDTVQTEGAWPLKRAYDRALETGMEHARRHRSECMWPWEHEPRSVAHGILDDETYDWAAVVEAMLATGGTPVVADEPTLVRAHALAHETTGIDVDPTGSAGLAGLLALRDAGTVGADERVAVLFTGVTRSPTRRERTHDEELPRTRHPVAQGLRAG
ncbi:MAG: pyridoxal-phosphate dependent enzyme [Pseudomonadota bacterium]